MSAVAPVTDNILRCRDRPLSANRDILQRRKTVPLGWRSTSDKTFIGKIERGFDFLGYHFSPEGLTVAKKTLAGFIEKASRLYEQERRQISSVFPVSPLEMYVRRWLRWSTGGIDGRVAQAQVLKGSGESGWLVWSGASSVGASALKRLLLPSPSSA